MRTLELSRQFVFLLIILTSLAWAFRSSAVEYSVQVDTSAHQKFGLYYPATYKFAIPNGSKGLTAQYRYSDSASWNALPEKSSGDLFNGIDAVRFDYATGFAYISVKFITSSDHIYLRVFDETGQEVNITFDSIPQYYDGRKAAVTIVLDDYGDWSNLYFRIATDYLRSYGLYYTIAVIADQVSSRWDWLQELVDLNSDYLEIASHSLTHPCSASDYRERGYQQEVVGSRDKIRSNLSFNNYPHIPVYVEPCGYSDETLVSWITAGGYLLARSANWSSAGAKFVSWDSAQGRYGRATLIFNDEVTDVNIQTEGNKLFDESVAAGAVYLLLDHPALGLWNYGSDLLGHLNYIKGRADIWYAPLGHLYEYHFLQEMRGNLSILPVSATSPTLSSIAVTPTNPTISAGVTQQFTATGTYSDSSNKDITSQVTWASSNESVSTITTAGLATGVANGTSNMSASLNDVTGSTTLTVQAATLSAIAVTPANPTISAGVTQQFTATGTYSDSSNKDITSQVTWASSKIGVATITATGLATSVAAGTTTISAALGGKIGSTTLTVQQLKITTKSLPNGRVMVSYSATLTASGGTQPYSWFIPPGSLPPGLLIDSVSGVISGTPTGSGTFKFTATVTNSTGEIATKALTIRIMK